MAHPLLCWDIVQEGIYRRQEFAKDILALDGLMKANKWVFTERDIANAMIWENKTIIITDTRLSIVLATKNMFEMNGYYDYEVIGKTPSIFQGKETTPASKKIIKTAIINQKPFECDIINYRRTGEVYNCHIEGYPVFNRTKELVNFIAFENVA